MTYLLRRIAQVPPTVLVVVAVTFFAGRLAPGDPVTTMAAGNVPADVIAAIQRDYGLERPLPAQFGGYLVRLLRGDLGVSYVRKATPVWDLAFPAWKVSLALGGATLAVALALGVPVGVYAAVRRGRPDERIVSALVMLVASVPGFALAYVAIRFLSVEREWFPLGGWGTAHQAVLPAIVAGLGPAAYCSRVLRASLGGSLDEEYIRTARAKGLTGRLVIFRHALPNAMAPLLALFGPLIGRLITGLFFVEAIFNIPGLAKLSVQSVFARDYAVMQGCVLLIAVSFIVVNLLTDLLAGVYDPRLRRA